MSWHDALSKKHQTRRPHKFGAEKITIGGRTFDSTSEGTFFGLLKLMERGGLIKDPIHHPGRIKLTRFVGIEPDYRWFENKRGIFVFGEYKGHETEGWRIKRNLWREFGEHPLQVWKKEKGRYFMHEELIGTIVTEGKSE